MFSLFFSLYYVYYLYINVFKHAAHKKLFVLVDLAWFCPFGLYPKKYHRSDFLAFNVLVFFFSSINV